MRRNAPTHGFALDDPRVIAVRHQFDALIDATKQAAVAAIGDFKQSQPGYPTRFFPSRLARAPRDRTLLAGVFTVAYREEIGKRLGQLNTLDRKLWRMCPDWMRHTEDELRAVPPVRWFGGEITL